MEENLKQFTLILILRLCQQYKLMQEGQKKTGVQGFFSPLLNEFRPWFSGHFLDSLISHSYLTLN